MKYPLIWFLRAYRLLISPLYGDVCRYWPTCSAYALEAVEVHGAARGSWLTVRRLSRCHPWAPGGVDKVPPRRRRGSVPLDDAAQPSQTDPAPTVREFQPESRPEPIPEPIPQREGA